jgi:glycosyltransferase involved in cell wall biosynthesis
MTVKNCTPRVSVIMASFNHGRFVASAIASVLGQTMADLELLIVDDGSVDRSPAVVSEIKDARVRYEFLERNHGACDAMNIALTMARGRFIAVCNSDDEWQRDKLEQQLAILETDTRAVAVFSDVEWIDEHGAPLVGERIPPGYAGIFKQHNRSRWSWIRDLLEGGNRLCHPSVLIRRDVYRTAGEYDNRLRQLPDLDMWIRVAAHHDIFVLPARLVRFRIHQSNTSTPRPDVMNRSINEHQIILRKTLSDISVDNFVRAFGIIATSVDDEIDFRIEKALYLLAYEGVYRIMFRQLGLELVYDIMGNTNSLERLSKKYGFNVFDFQREMAVHSSWLQYPTAEAACAEVNKARAEAEAACAEVNKARAEAEAACAEVNKARAEADAARAQVNALLSSTTWRATATLRATLSRLPPGVRWQLRRAAKVAWWAVTPWRIPRRLVWIKERLRRA